MLYDAGGREREGIDMRKQQPTCIPCMALRCAPVHDARPCINASIKQPALFLARGPNSHALCLPHSVQISPLAPFAAPILCTTRPAVVRGNVVLCLCDPHVRRAATRFATARAVRLRCAWGLCSDGPSSPSGGRAGSHFISHHDSSWAMMKWRSHREY